MQIIVLGMHRSGTSLVTRLINMMGAYFASEGVSIGFNEENPKGFWERRDVIETDDAILALHGCTWDEVANWQPGPPHLDSALEKQLKNIILDLDAHRPWVIKDPRLCLTLDSWTPYLEVPLAVVMYRDPLEVAKSLQTRGGMPLHEGIALWEYYTVAMLNASANMKRIFIRHDAFMKDPVAATQSLHESLASAGVRGLRLPSEQEIVAFVEPKYYRSHMDGAHERYLTPPQLALMEYANGKDLPNALTLSDGARAVMEFYGQRKQEQADREREYTEHAAQLAQRDSTKVALERSLAEKESAWAAERENLIQQRLMVEVSLNQASTNNTQLRDEIAALKTSASWKLGHGIIAGFRKLAGWR